MAMVQNRPIEKESEPHTLLLDIYKNNKKKGGLLSVSADRVGRAEERKLAHA